MNVRVAAALAYLALMTVWVYVVWNAGIQPRGWLGDAFGVSLAVLQVGVGFAVGRWWALALPLLLVVVAVPAGYGPALEAERPVWVHVLFEAPRALVLLAAGVGARKLFVRRR